MVLGFSQNSIKLLSLLWLTIGTIFSCNKNLEVKYVPILQKHEVYVILRGTNSKEGIIAKSYNTLDKRPSHSGILIYDNEQWLVYHIIPNKKDKTALVVNTLEEFMQKTQESNQFFAILQENIGYNQIHDEIRKQLKVLTDSHIYFDYDFCLENAFNYLYCSEFVVKVLSQATDFAFNPTPLNATVIGLHSAFLQRAYLDYYPVDFFLSSECFELVYEESI